MEKQLASLLALLGKDECTLVIVLHCLDSHILILQYVICILFREEFVSKCDMGFGIDVRETLRQTFGLGPSYIGRSVVLSVEVTFLHLVAINYGNVFKAKSERAFRNDASYACSANDNPEVLDYLLFFLAHVESVAGVSVFHFTNFIFCKNIIRFQM